MSGLGAFYEAMPYYGGTYVAFFAIEFALYETVLREIENRCQGKSALGTILDHTLEQVNLLLKVGPATFKELIDSANDTTRPQLMQRLVKPPKEYGIIDELDEINEDE